MKTYLYLVLLLLALGAAPVVAQVQSPEEYKQAAVKAGLDVWVGKTRLISSNDKKSTIIGLVDADGAMRKAYVVYGAELTDAPDKLSLVSLPNNGLALVSANGVVGLSTSEADVQRLAKVVKPLSIVMVNGLATCQIPRGINEDEIKRFQETGQLAAGG